MMSFNKKIGYWRLRSPFIVPLRLGTSSTKLLRAGMAILLASALSFITLALPYLRSYSAQPTDRELTRTGKSSEGLAKTFGELPLAFELNQGQVNHQVKFLSRGVGSEIYLTTNEVILNLRRPTRSGESRADSGDNCQGLGKIVFQHGTHGQSDLHSRDLVKMRLEGANQSARIEGVDELPGTVNYFIGKNPKNWHTDIQTYRKVAYRNVYPGIDQIFYGNEQRLEYDFIVSPGANPHSIKIAFKGESDAAIDSQGDLVLHSKGSQEIRLHKPFVYQEINGEKHKISARYVMRGKRQVGFEISNYDVSQPLIIDPVLSYSTYFGGSGNDTGFGVAVDSSGNAYISGSTDSNELSTLGGSNAFVAKLNAAGTQRQYLSIIGGGGDDTGFDIAVDGAGNAYITGSTNSTDFPLMNAAQPNFGGGSQDAFVAKLNAAGSALVYSTYLGGSGNDAGFGVAVDGNGSAYVTGSTDSGEYSSLVGSNAFVAKLNAEGSQRTYLSILGGSGDDVGFSIAVDSGGNAYITGSTDSPDFTVVNPLQPAIGGSQDAFIAKLNPAGSAPIYSTYFGGSGSDAGFDIAVDSAGNAYVTGSTNSPEFSNLGGTDAFVVKLNAAGNERSYFAILGGSGDDVGFSIALDGANNAYVTGSSNSNNFTTINSLQPNIAGAQDAFVAKLNPAGSSLIYSTFLGGSGNDAGFGIAVDNTGTAYVTGFTNSSDFITLSALQPAPGGNGDAFIAKIIDDGSTTPTPTPTPTPTSTPSPTPPQSNPIDGSQFFVTEHYLDFLNRQPDASGLQFWVNNIESCGTDQNCRVVKRVDTSAAFFISIEFQQTGYFVYKTYKAAFGNINPPTVPVPVRRASFLSDTQRIASTPAQVIVGQGDWQGQLDTNKTAYAQSFVQRSDFLSKYPAGMAAGSYVDTLFSTAGVTPTATERSNAVTAYGAGDVAGRAAALRSVVESSTLQQGEFNRAFVLMQYFGYLQRDPDSGQDTDYSGYNFWLNKLNLFNGNYVQAEMVKAFITSIEYRQRFGQP